MPEILKPLDYQNKLINSYDIKAIHNNIINIKKPSLIKEKESLIKGNLIYGIPSEFLAIFLLSQNNKNIELSYDINEKIINIPLVNIPKLGNKLSDILIGFELNKNVITQEIKLLNSQVVTVRGAPLKKGSIEILIKAYNEYKKSVFNNDKNKMTLRKLISLLNHDKSKNGKQNLITMMHLLLLSKVELKSNKEDSNLNFPFTRLFKIESADSDAKEAIRQLIRESRLKQKYTTRGGIKIGCIMNICKNIFVNFTESAFEKLLRLHTKIKDDGTIKPIGSYFRYNFDISPSAARLCAVLDTYRTYTKKLGHNGSLLQNTIAKTFSLETILALCGQAIEAKKNPKRFVETCKIASSVFGAIFFTKLNFSVIYGEYSKAETNGEEKTQNQNLVGNISETNGEVTKSYSENTTTNPPIVIKKVFNKKAVTSNTNLNIQNIKRVEKNVHKKIQAETKNLENINSIKSNNNPIEFNKNKIARNEDLNTKLNFSNLSPDVKAFIDTFKPISKSIELIKLRRSCSIELYEKEIKALSTFYKFSKNYAEKRSA